MATPGVGHLSYVQIAKQTAVATAGTASHRYELISWNVPSITGAARDRSLNSSAVSRRSLSPVGLLHKGSFTVRANYEGAPMLWNLATTLLGARSGTVSPYTYTFKESSRYQRSTIFLVPGASTIGSVQQLVYVDSYITGVTVRCGAGSGDDSMMTWEFDFVSPTMTQSTSAPTSLTTATPRPISFNHANTYDMGLGAAPSDTRIRNFEVSFKQPFSEDRFYVGSLTADSGLRTDFATCQWRFTSELQTSSAWDAVANSSTNLAPVLTFTEPGATGRSFQIKSSSAMVTEYSNPIESYGVIQQNMTMEAAYNTGDASAIVATIVDTVSITVP